MAFPELDVQLPRLATGGMNNAYRCNEAGSDSVLKIFRQELPEISDEAEPDDLPIRIARELRAMQAIDHPAIGKIVLGPGTRSIGAARRGWYVEPYYTGGTLSDRIGVPWPTTETLRFTNELLRCESLCEW